MAKLKTVKIYINAGKRDSSLREVVRKACEAAFANEGTGIKAEIGITFVTEDVIRNMNKVYRGKDTVTDVLSFPADAGPDGTLLGDIFICYEQAVRQAGEIGNTVEREIAFLTAHGTLHLLGYDHNDGENEKIMILKQKEILGNI
ncbi:MAG: rRNA maturation RNase YbeY [Defluviitaleaceae bacterium]|nr:rRNA maturation RNase YbeY [Defluviitaleaceae bacterium]MCL2837371.1 rRNA maturation RNase YbeY [Defluviitaleaceae bacterium]